MSAASNNQLKPRNGHTLVVGIGCRISGCQNQKEISNEDQADHGKEVIAEMYTGPVEYRIIATKGKGERLDRPELAVMEAMFRTRELDVFVFEDIGRMVRGAHAVRLCGIAVDHKTRVLAPHDCIDTAEDSWEEDVMQACRDHVSHNAHTSKRLKHKLMNRFLKLGGATALPIAGYHVPPDAKTYDHWQKIEEATPIIREAARLLRLTLNCETAASYLNSVAWGDGMGFPTGPYCTRKAWNGKMVRRYFLNSLLAGRPARGHRHTVKWNENGERKSRVNPNGPNFRDCAQLAHLTWAELEDLNCALAAQNDRYRRKKRKGIDPLTNVPRKRTRYPGQGSRCWYCGRQYVWGGNGITANLMCTGAREWRCWNSVGFNGTIAVKQVVNAVMAQVYQLDGIDAQLRELVTVAQSENGLADRWKKLLAEEARLLAEKDRVKSALRKRGDDPIIFDTLDELRQTEIRLAAERHALERAKSQIVALPASTSQLRALYEEQFASLAQDSMELGVLVRQIVPRFDVYLVRLCDGGHLLPRARVTTSLAGIHPGARLHSGLEALLTHEMTLDLFEPPQRERIREEAARLEAKGLDQRDIARHLTEPATQAAVSKALLLERRMKELNLMSPYVLVEAPPADYPKLRRHKNPKYRFEPLAGYERQPL
ncbi:MAG: hypothetical protein ACJ8C4_13855 [Gemmataceae bacterium]